MKNFLRFIRHLFCRNVVWLYPDLAMYDRDDDHVYRIRCKKCGYKISVTAWHIKDAVNAGIAETMTEVQS